MTNKFEHIIQSSLETHVFSMHVFTYTPKHIPLKCSSVNEESQLLVTVELAAFGKHPVDFKSSG
jgi:hypothetical protein